MHFSTPPLLVTPCSIFYNNAVDLIQLVTKIFHVEDSSNQALTSEPDLIQITKDTSIEEVDTNPDL